MLTVNEARGLKQGAYLKDFFGNILKIESVDLKKGEIHTDKGIKYRSQLYFLNKIDRAQLKLEAQQSIITSNLVEREV